MTETETETTSRVIERVNNVPLTASKGSLSEGAVSRRLTEGVTPVPPAGGKAPSPRELSAAG